MSERGWLVLVIVVVLVGAIALYWTRDRKSVVPESQTTESVAQATFACTEGRSITAVFDRENDSVQLSLSDGRQIELSRELSASGARYATADESFVFWNKGDTAFITESGEATYQDCVTGS